jgi:hypothetical protein
MLLQPRLYRVAFPDADDVASVGAYDAFDTSSLLGPYEGFCLF